MFYSASTCGFYSKEIHGNNMPHDVVEITTDQHAELIKGQSIGLCIQPDNNGFPVLVEREITHEQVIAAERVWRNNELIRADIELNKVQDGMGVGTVSDWREYRCLLRNWPKSEFFPDSTKRPLSPDLSVA